MPDDTLSIETIDDLRRAINIRYHNEHPLTNAAIHRILTTARVTGWTVTPPQPKYRAARHPSSLGIDFYEVVDRDGGSVALFRSTGTDASNTNRLRAEAYAAHLNATHARMDQHEHDES